MKQNIIKSLCVIVLFCAVYCIAATVPQYGALPQASPVYDPERFKYPVSKGSQNYKWKEVGRNKAAVSSDCLYVQHGPSKTLAECEAACANQTLCNAINYNAEIPDCVFRACRDPEDPELTRTSGYDCYTISKKFVPMPSNASLVKLTSSPQYLSKWAGRNITFFGVSSFLFKKIYFYYSKLTLND